jgi:hypothetical protein
MTHRKALGTGLRLLAVAAFATLGAGCSKSSQATTSTSTSESTSTTLAPVRSIDGWSAEQLPNPAGASDSLLTGVSCVSATACTAVGAYRQGTGNFLSLVEQWNGSTWRSTPGAESTGESRLLGISCSSAISCFAAGETQTTSERALVERWNGKSWADIPVPVPENASASGLTGISCYSPAACTAVGFYRVPPLGRTYVLLERWNGRSWELQVAPALPAHVTSFSLFQVSCPSATACTGVGQSTTKSGSNALVEYWNGATWATQALPVLGGLRNSKFSGVSCVSPSYCAAVGSATNQAKREVSLAELWDGREWKVQSIPGLANRQLALSAVSCRMAGECVAVGSETIALYSASRWTVQPAPFALGGESNFSGSSAVACTTSGACKAVGVSVSGLGLTTMLVLSN